MPMKMETVTPGDGKTFPQRGQTVKVHYVSWRGLALHRSFNIFPVLMTNESMEFDLQVGTFGSGQEFDSSRKRSEPFTFKIGMGQVIKGWDEGVKQMSKGQRAKFEFSPDLAYGAQGYPPVIPGNATLYFDIELIDMS